ncbi:MAG: tripartite tricarboxylate transporter TctB family protein [Burkholderiaceae bacterium]|jgi:hypothetical protein
MSVIASRRITIDWGHLLTVLAIAAWALWYLADVRSVSLSPENILLVQPLTIIFLLMLAAVLPQCFRAEKLPDELKPEPLDARSFARILAIMVAFIGLVWCMFAVGFDIAVFLFCFVGLAICGERRWWAMLVFAALCSVVMVKGYQLLAPFPMPTLILG